MVSFQDSHFTDNPLLPNKALEGLDLYSGSFYHTSPKRPLLPLLCHVPHVPRSCRVLYFSDVSGKVTRSAILCIK